VKLSLKGTFKYYMTLQGGFLKPSECRDMGKGFGQIVMKLIVAEKANVVWGGVLKLLKKTTYDIERS